MAGGIPAVIAKPSVSEDEAAEIMGLADHCNRLEGLDLKLEVPRTVVAAESMPRAFLVYVEGGLAGYCGLDYNGGSDAEVCGMVRPERRGQGIGRALLAAARATCQTYRILRLSAVCDDASASGRGFLTRMGAWLASSELHMEREARGLAAPVQVGGAAPRRLSVRPATTSDSDTVAHIVAAAFSDDEEGVRRRVQREIADPHGPFLLAERDGVAIGSLKVYAMGPETGIYAFAILPEHQGRGYAKEFLSLAMEHLAPRGDTRFVLEVDDFNAPALAVYHACGFAVTTTYRYYAVDL